MKQRKIKYPHCKPENKTAYPDEDCARRGVTLIWGSDPSADLSDLHVYRCLYNADHFHIGHRSYYEKFLSKNESLPDLRSSILPN